MVTMTQAKAGKAKPRDQVGEGRLSPPEKKEPPTYERKVFSFKRFSDFQPIFIELPPWLRKGYVRPDSPMARRNALVNEITNVDDLANSFDLRAFPLSMRMVVEPCYNYGCNDSSHAMGARTAHVYMRIKPRDDANELPGIPRDANGTCELRTCAGVSEKFRGEKGNDAAVEKIRVAIQNMVMHEVYEALLFRGERIMNPHDSQLRPAHQPF